jgi:hypothetical protein
MTKALKMQPEMDDGEFRLAISLTFINLLFLIRSWALLRESDLLR